MNRERQRQVQILADAAEERMVLHLNRHIQVAGRTAPRAGVPASGNGQARA